MTSATLDRLLAILLAAIAATGLLSLRAGAPAEAWVFAVHGVLGGALFVAIVVKLRRTVPGSLRRAGRGRRLTALAVTTVAALSVLAGLAAVATGRLVIIGPWTLISWHAVLGLALLPLLVVHLLPRRWRLLRPRLSGRVRHRERSGIAGPSGGPHITRRSLLTGSTFGVLAIALVGSGTWAAASILDLLAGGVRRFTGSRWLPRGGVPPVTTFFGEGAPNLDAASWRLAVSGRVARPRSYSLVDLGNLGEREVVAVLDCTSGWAIETVWRGLPLATILADAGADPSATRIEVRSATGWGAGLGAADLPQALLATMVAGQPLPTGNGAPCRLVVEGRRGLDWVKWVTAIEVL